METCYSWVDCPTFEGTHLQFGDILEVRKLSDLGLEVYYSSDRWVVDILHGRYFQAGFLATSDSELRLVNKVQAVLNNWIRRRMPSRWRVSMECAGLPSRWRVSKKCASKAETLRACPPEEPARPSYAVVVSAVILLASVYQYLTGNVDRGGSKAYSRGSLDFRDIYVAIVLFQGAYVWIKFRDVARKGVYSRKLKDREGRITKVVHEPRFKPPRENGTVFDWIYLGQYDTPEEASILYRIAAFYYDEDQGSSLQLELEDGRWFSIPPMSEGARSLAGLEKRVWVKLQVMKVYEEFKKEKAEAAKRLQELQLQPWEDEGFAVPNGHSLGPQERPAIPVSQLPPSTQSGMGSSSSTQLDLLQIVHNMQELITYQQQQLSLKEQQLQDCRAQISELKYQHYLQQMRQDINEGVPSNEVEAEQSMYLQNQEVLPYAGAESHEAFI